RVPGFRITMSSKADERAYSQLGRLQADCKIGTRHPRAEAARRLHGDARVEVQSGERTGSGVGVRVVVVLLLKKPEPAERAAHILREASDKFHCDIATLLRPKEINARRQVVTCPPLHVG